MKGWVVTRNAADGTKRYDARWRIAPGKIRGRTFNRKKDAEHYLTTMVGRVQDGSYVDVQPVPMGRVFDEWAALELDVRLKEGSLTPASGSSYRSRPAQPLRPPFDAYRSDRFTLAVVEHWRAGIATQIAAGALSPKVYVHLRNPLRALSPGGRQP